MGRRRVVAFVSIGSLVLGAIHCSEEPTQIVVDLRASEDDCATMTSTVVREGPLKQIDSAPISGEKRSCDPHTESIGRVVLIPRNAVNASFGFQAVSGVNQKEASTCVQGDPNCIFQSRLLTFRPNQTVHIEIFMSGACRGKVCPEGQTCNPRGVCVANEQPPGCEAPPCTPPPPPPEAGPPIDAGVDAPSTGEEGIRCLEKRCFDPHVCTICGTNSQCGNAQGYDCSSSPHAQLYCDDPSDCVGSLCCIEIETGGVIPLFHGGGGGGGGGYNRIRSNCEQSCGYDEAEMCVPNGAPCRDTKKTCKPHPKLTGYFVCLG